MLGAARRTMKPGRSCPAHPLVIATRARSRPDARMQRLATWTRPSSPFRARSTRLDPLLYGESLRSVGYDGRYGTANNLP